MHAESLFGEREREKFGSIVFLVKKSGSKCLMIHFLHWSSVIVIFGLCVICGSNLEIPVIV